MEDVFFLVSGFWGLTGLFYRLHLWWRSLGLKPHVANLEMILVFVAQGDWLHVWSLGRKALEPIVSMLV